VAKVDAFDEKVGAYNQVRTRRRLEHCRVVSNSPKQVRRSAVSARLFFYLPDEIEFVHVQNDPQLTRIPQIRKRNDRVLPDVLLLESVQSAKSADNRALI
jgi:hypothetical protein